MKIQRKAYGVQTESLGDRQVKVVISTPSVDRAGEVIVQSGIDLTGFRANPMVLWDHNHDHPIAKALEISVSDAETTAFVEFAPAGISAKADEICGLVKAGFINSVSIGFLPVEVEMMPGGDRKKGPFKYLSCDLMEFSFVSVPALPDAGVIARAARPKEKAMEKKTVPAAKALIVKLGRGSVEKGLWEVGRLASLLMELGWLEDSVEWEAQAEQDGSAVPAALASAMAALGKVLIDMTVEEVTEMIGGEAGEAVEDDEPLEVIELGCKAFSRGFRGKTLKAGRAISSSNAETLAAGCKSIMDGHDMIKSVIPDDESEVEASEDAPIVTGDDTVSKAARAARAKRLRALEVLRLAAA